MDAACADAHLSTQPKPAGHTAHTHALVMPHRVVRLNPRNKPLPTFKHTSNFSLTRPCALCPPSSLKSHRLSSWVLPVTQQHSN
jgi:hypothetical protein